MLDDKRPLLLLVDDDETMRLAMRSALEDVYDIHESASGEAALAFLKEAATGVDLVLLDIEMKGIDGYETCRQMRHAGLLMPVIFVSVHDSLEERLAVFDAGGDDFVSKPYQANELLFKVKHSLDVIRLQSVTTQTITEAFESNVLLNFMRQAIRLVDYERLAKLVIETVSDYGVRCHLQVRSSNGTINLTAEGEPTELERSIIERAVAMGPEFRFSRRLVINKQYLSLLALNMPADPARAQRLTDYFNVLIESAEAIAETIELRQESAGRAETLMVASARSARVVENLREGYREQQMNTRFLLEELINEVERTYVHLGLTDRQEDTVSSTLRHSAEKILLLFDKGAEFDSQFAEVLDVLQPKQNQDADVWL